MSKFDMHEVECPECHGTWELPTWVLTEGFELFSGPNGMPCPHCKKILTSILFKAEMRNSKGSYGIITDIE